MRAITQTSRRALFALVFTLLTQSLLADQTGVTVPFKLERGYMVMVNGEIQSKAIRVKIDTGATHSVLDPRAARRLGIKPIKRSVTIIAFGRKIRLYRAVVSRLRLGDHVVSALPCVLGDLSFNGADLLLGLDALRRTSLTIDYENRLLSFDSGSSGGATERLLSETGLALIRVQVEGHPVVLAIDSGAKRINLFKDRIGTLRRDLRDLGRARVGTLAGRQTVRRVELDRVTLAGLSWQKQEAFLLSHAADSLADGVLGLGDLGIGKIHIDFVRSEIRIFPQVEL